MTGLGLTRQQGWHAVVCGAGVGGLSAARALGGLGLRVLLLEKQRRTPRPVAKGEVLQPSSLRILREWGVLDRLLDHGAVPLRRLVVRDADGSALMVFDYEALDGEFRSLLADDYPAILAALADSLPSGVAVRRGALAHELLRDPAGRVTGVRIQEGGRAYEQRCALVVAADGMSSRLRRAAGIAAEPVEYGHRLLSFDIKGAPGTRPEVSAYRTRRGLRLVYPLPHGRTRLYGQIRPDELRGADRSDLVAWCTRLAADTPELDPLIGPLHGSLGTRQVLPLWRFTASRLAVPGVALVGESAHAVHSMAAQGMNTAIADAHALAGRLAGTDPAEEAAVDRALEAYHAERRRWVHHIDLMSHDATRLINETAWPIRALRRRALLRIHRSRRMSYIATYNLAGLGIRPFTVLDRLHQLGLPDPRSGDVPSWAREPGGVETVSLIEHRDRQRTRPRNVGGRDRER